jgi:zinc transport system substrate-binding protein
MKYFIGIVGVAVLGVAAYTFIYDKSGHDGDHELEITAAEPVRADGEFSIVTSFYPLQFALERIVGDLGVVTNIGEGVDPHDFRPATQDIVTLQRADLVVLQGADFEPWSDAVVDQLAADKKPVLLATADIELRAGGLHDDGEKHEDEHEEEEHDDHDEHEDEHERDAHEESDEHDEHAEEGHDDHGAFDPHTWLDPVLFAEMVTHMTEAIVTLDPENADIYNANAAALQAELVELDTIYAQTLAACELDEVITSHDAFGYVAARYGFDVHAIAGLSTQNSPSVTTLAELKEEAEEGIGAILLEENSIAAYGETLARETGLQTLSINPIAFIVPAGDSYLTLMQKNLETFAAALKCNG